MKNNVLKVMLWGEEVGKIYWDENRKTSIFNYNREFVKKGLDIAPFTASIHGQYGKGLPFTAVSLKSDSFYKGVPHFLADSLPEKWGTTLFNCWAKSQGLDYNALTPIDRLAFIGKRAMGAFEFVPDTYPWNKDKDIDLHKLYDLATRIYEQREEIVLKPEDNNLMAGLCEIGTSAGGQHSKAVIAINDTTGEIRSGQIELPAGYTYYLLKFAEGTDFPTAQLEMAYYEMAKEAGINMMPSRLLNIEGTSHFLTQRYDRVGGEKIFTQTISALMPGVDSYDELFYTSDKLGIKEKEREELFRRMVFNLFSGNIDDHNRNFSFTMDKEGVWNITPAYDLMFTADIGNAVYGNHHSFSMSGKSDRFTVDDLKRFADYHGIKNADGMIKDVLTAISKFHYQAKKTGVGDFATDKIEKFLASIMPVEYGRKMTHYMGNKFEPYVTESGFEIKDFQITETPMHDFELRAIVNDSRYRTIVDGESEEGDFIKSKGGNRMDVKDIRLLIDKHIMPKAERARDKWLLYKIKEANRYDNDKMIRCKIDNQWMPGKKIDEKDMDVEDEYDLALKYFRDELMESFNEQQFHKNGPHE